MSEKEKILQMIAEGKITVEDGERLLRAIGAQKKDTGRPRDLVKLADKAQGKSKKGKIVIDIKSSRGENVKVNVPLKLANWAATLIPKERLIEVENDGINIREILANITDMIDDSGEDIVNITSPGGDQVRIYVEKE